jgi:hypothetical protein
MGGRDQPCGKAQILRFSKVSLSIFACQGALITLKGQIETQLQALLDRKIREGRILTFSLALIEASRSLLAD